jgi:hypothetical protein
LRRDLHIPILMTHGPTRTVDCSLCGRPFDPSEGDERCPNPDCDARQSNPDPARVVPDGGHERPAGGDDETVPCPECESPVGAEDNFCRECGTDVSHLEPGGELTNCPSCDADVEPEDNFCRNCGEDLDAHRPPGATGVDDGPASTGEDPDTSTGGATGQGGETTGEPGSDRGTPASQSGGDTTGQPAADTGEQATGDEVPAGDSGDLARDPTEPRTPEDTGERTPEAGGQTADQTDDPGGADESVPGGQSAGAAGGQADDAPAGGTGGQTSEETDESTEQSLTVHVREKDITVPAGETLGKQVRRAMIDAGDDEEDAVCVHREHVRFERESGAFYLVDLGRNSTVVNGEQLEQGDRVPVSEGDRIELSNVAELHVTDA